MDINKKWLMFSVLVWTIIFSSILYVDYRDDYTYRAYILHDQHIGDIIVDGKLYTGILIMDVEPLRNKEGDVDLYYDENKYGWYLSCVVDSGNPYYNGTIPYHGLIRTSETTRLYFAGENNIRCDLVDGEVIGVRWTNQITHRPFIRGVGPLKSGYI